MRSFPARLAFATPFWAIGQAHRASVITVFARKQATGEMPA
jgi:hypothetical protein